jgi:hypothetical protein
MINDQELDVSPPTMHEFVRDCFLNHVRSQIMRAAGVTVPR